MHRHEMGYRTLASVCLGHPHTRGESSNEALVPSLARGGPVQCVWLSRVVVHIIERASENNIPWVG